MIKSKYSDLKKDFKVFNRSTLKDLKELENLFKNKGIYSFNEPLNNNAPLQKQPSQPAAAVQLVSTDQFKRNAIIIPKEDDRKDQEVNQQQSQSNINNLQQPTQKLNEIFQKPKSDSQPKLQLPFFQKDDANNNRNDQQNQKPNIQPNDRQNDIPSTNNNNNNASNYTNNNNNNYNNNYNNNGNNFNMNNKYGNQNQVQSEEKTILVDSKMSDLIKIQHYGKTLILLQKQVINIYDENKTYLLGDANPNALQQIYKLPSDCTFTNCSIHNQLAVFFVEQKQSGEEQKTYGLLLLKLDTANMNQSRIQFIKNVSITPITSYFFIEDADLFGFSTASGIIQAFNTYQTKVFEFEEPDSNEITSLIANIESDEIIYSTNKGDLNVLSIINQEVKNVLKIDGSISHLELILDRRCVLVLHSENNDNFATLLHFPSLKFIYKISTIPAKHAFFSHLQTPPNISHSSYHYFALLSDKSAVVYQVALSQPEQTILYKKQFHSTPQCIYFNIEFNQGIITIYYNNPTQVIKNSHSEDSFRVCQDRIINSEQSN